MNYASFFNINFNANFCFLSDEWKGCFRWLEASFPMVGSKASDGWKKLSE